MIIFFALIILFVLYGYVSLRLITPSLLNSAARKILWIMTGVSMLLPVVSFAFLDLKSPAFTWIIFLIFGVFTILFFFIFIRDIVFALLFVISKVYISVRKTADSRLRKSFIFHNSSIRTTNRFIIYFSLVLACYGVITASLPPFVKHVEIPSDKALNGISIVHISDLHIGRTLGKDFVDDTVRRVNGLSPDIIVLVGDVADGTVKQLNGEMESLKELKAPMGKYYVTGNHEYYFGAEQWVEEMERLGFTTLFNSHKLLHHNGEEIVIAGVPDYTSNSHHQSHFSDPLLAMRGSPPSAYKILLAHNPQSAHSAVKSKYDLVLSGHTHGGQYFPGNILVKLFYPNSSGLFQIENTLLYVSRGTGYWGPPLRIFFPSEITLFTFK